MLRRDAFREIRAAHRKHSHIPPRTSATHEEVTRLARDALRAALDLTKDQELDCGECHELLDRFAELHAEGQDVRALLPLVYLHLQACGDCFEEFEALRRIVTAAR